MFQRAPGKKAIPHPKDQEFKKSHRVEPAHCVRGLFKLTNSRVLAYTHNDVYILDFNYNPPRKTRTYHFSMAGFEKIISCLELSNDRLVISWLEGKFPNPSTRHCLFYLREQKESRLHGYEINPIFGKTTQLAPDLFASLAWQIDPKTQACISSIKLIDAVDSIKILAVTELKKSYSSLTALNSETLILSGEDYIDLYRKNTSNQFECIGSLLSQMHDKVQLVQMIGKNRDILFVAGYRRLHAWRWDRKSEKLTMIADVPSPLKFLVSGLTELEEGLLVLHKYGPDHAYILDAQLNVYPLEGVNQVVQFPGVDLTLSEKGELTQWELRQDVIKEKIKTDSPIFQDPLAKIMAEYYCAEEAEKVGTSPRP